MRTPVAIVGGGISGLAAAYELTQRHVPSFAEIPNLFGCTAGATRRRSSRWATSNW